MYVAHRGLNVIVSSNVLQRKRVGVLPGFGQKRVAQCVQARIGMSFDLGANAGDLLFKHPGTQRLSRVLRAGENKVALGLPPELFEDFLHFAVNHELAFPCSSFQAALYYELSIDFPIVRKLLRV